MARKKKGGTKPVVVPDEAPATPRAAREAARNLQQTNSNEDKKDDKETKREPILERIVEIQSNVIADLKKRIWDLERIGENEHMNVHFQMTEPKESLEMDMGDDFFEEDGIAKYMRPVQPEKKTVDYYCGFRFLLFTLTLIVKTILDGARNTPGSRTIRGHHLVSKLLQDSSFQICGLRFQGLSKRLKDCIKWNGNRVIITAGKTKFQLNQMEGSHMECQVCEYGEDLLTIEDPNTKFVSILSTVGCAECSNNIASIPPFLWLLTFPRKKDVTLDLNLVPGVVRKITANRMVFKNYFECPITVYTATQGVQFEAQSLQPNERRQVEYTNSSNSSTLVEFSITKETEGKEKMAEFCLIFNE